MADTKTGCLVMKLASTESNRMKELVVAYLNGDVRAELCRRHPTITQNMFNNVVTALRSEHPMEVIYQLITDESGEAFELRVKADQGLTSRSLDPVLLLPRSYQERQQNLFSLRSIPSK
jgi:hypothetical protein